MFAEILGLLEPIFLNYLGRLKIFHSSAVLHSMYCTKYKGRIIYSIGCDVYHYVVTVASYIIFYVI